MNFEGVPIREITLPPDVEKYRPVVLVVDDEVVIADTLGIILSRSGFAPIVAYGGSSALETAEVIPPDILLSDVAMPGMTGVDLAIAVTGMAADCKVLLFSGQSSTTDILAEARDAGYDFPMLTKPVHPRVLLDCLTKCLGVPRAPVASSASGPPTMRLEGSLFSTSINVAGSKAGMGGSATEVRRAWKMRF